MITRDWYYNPETNHIFVSNTGDRSVSEIDGRGHRVIDRVRVGRGPRGGAVDPDTNRVYIANSRRNTISVIQDSR